MSVNPTDTKPPILRAGDLPVSHDSPGSATSMQPKHWPGRPTPGARTTASIASGSHSFEFDNIAAAVPEPGTWAMILAGLALPETV